jgi:hypothetical protein
MAEHTTDGCEHNGDSAELIEGTRDPRFADAWNMASADSFRPVPALAAA